MLHLAVSFKYGLQAPFIQAEKEASLPSLALRSSELDFDTCSSLTTTRKGGHFNQDIKKGNEMNKKGALGKWILTEEKRKEKRREEEKGGRIDVYSLALFPDPVFCPSALFGCKSLFQSVRVCPVHLTSLNSNNAFPPINMLWIGEYIIDPQPRIVILVHPVHLLLPQQLNHRCLNHPQ